MEVVGGGPIFQFEHFRPLVSMHPAFGVSPEELVNIDLNLYKDILRLEQDSIQKSTYV